MHPRFDLRTVNTIRHGPKIETLRQAFVHVYNEAEFLPDIPVNGIADAPSDDEDHADHAQVHDFLLKSIAEATLEVPTHCRLEDYIADPSGLPPKWIQIYSE